MAHADPETHPETQQQHHHGYLTLITAGENETVPNGIPYGAMRLVSLDTREVKAWVEKNKQYSIFMMPGSHLEMEGVPALTVPVSFEDYDVVTKAMPL